MAAAFARRARAPATSLDGALPAILPKVRACPRCQSPYLNDASFCGIDGAELIEVDRDPLLGKTVDRYQITELLGYGAMGCVFRGRHLLLHRDFALKVLYGDLAANKTLIERFHREARALSRIRHTNIVSVVDFLTTPDGLNLLIMDYLPGETLASAIKRDAPFTHWRAASIIRQIAAGLSAAHALGIIHRDVKPSNVLLVPEGTEEVVKLLDFGIVALEDAEERGERLTEHGNIIGTPTYMAPEASECRATRASDLYAAGVILYEMLAGVPPFASTRVIELLLQHASAKPPRIPSSGGLESLVESLLEKDPAARPTAEDVIAEIDRLRVNWSLAPVLSTTSEPAPPPPKTTRTRRKYALAAALGSIALTAVIGATSASKILSRGDAEIEESSLEDPSPYRISATLDEPPNPSVVTPPPSTGPGGAALDLRPAVRPPRPKGEERKVSSAGPKPAATDEAPTKANLHKRLDRLLKVLRGASREIPENLLSECDNRYLELRANVSDAQSERDLRKIAGQIARLEARLQKLRQGDMLQPSGAEP